MYLKRFDVQGFKSYANKIVFDFHNGITGIVGPNGSGKSNILEAISIILSCLYNGQSAPFNNKIVYDLAGQSQIVES